MVTALRVAKSLGAGAVASWLLAIGRLSVDAYLLVAS